jgi:hypothetical protein
MIPLLLIMDIIKNNPKYKNIKKNFFSKLFFIIDSKINFGVRVKIVTKNRGSKYF